jgi:hypothetical protein
MTPKKLQRFRGRIAELRRAKAVKSRDMVRLAEAIGRTLSNRGKEPTYIHEELISRRPISIPNHPTLSIGVKNNILDDLDGDLDAYEERFIEGVAAANGDLLKKNTRRLS